MGSKMGTGSEKGKEDVKADGDGDGDGTGTRTHTHTHTHTHTLFVTSIIDPPLGGSTRVA